MAVRGATFSLRHQCLPQSGNRDVTLSLNIAPAI